MDGFYVPGSMVGSYVSNKRDENGSLIYESSATNVGMQAQSAFQQLEKNYATTIENAYSSYLSANRSVGGSMMGQGYKEQYQALQQQSLQQQMIADALQIQQSAASIQQTENEALSALHKQFQTEVGYLDRVGSTLSQYFEYAKTLNRKQNGQTTPWLTDAQKKESIDNMYQFLAQEQPRDTLDAHGNVGMSYQEWVKSQLSTSDADNMFSQWFYNGGVNEFLAAQKGTDVVLEDYFVSGPDGDREQIRQQKREQWIKEIRSDTKRYNAIKQFMSDDEVLDLREFADRIGAEFDWVDLSKKIGENLRAGKITEDEHKKYFALTQKLQRAYLKWNGWA